MKAIIILFSAAILLSACGGDKKETKETATTTETPFVGDSVLTRNFYKRFEGTIADQPVVMQLQCMDGRVEGMYYYTAHGQWIMLNAMLDSIRDVNKLKLTESSFEDGETSAVMDLVYKEGTLKGTWAKTDKTSYNVDLKEAYPEGSYTFTTLLLMDSAKAFPERDSSPVAQVRKELVLPTQTGEAGVWLETECKEIVGIDSSIRNLPLAEGAKKMNGKYVKSYKDEMKEMGDDAFAAFMNYEEQLNMSVRFNENGYVIIEASVYAYTGGAHGNGGSNFSCLDVFRKKKLKLKDVLTADSSRLQPIVEHLFRKQQNLKPTDSLNTILFDNHLALTDNFYFTSKGIGFWYFPYEVAAYAYGPIHVFVPFTEVRQYLNPEFVQRMKL